MLALIGALGAIVGFGTVVAFHELGHFLGGLLTKTAMDEFSIGMGPKVWGREFGRMQFNLRVLPLGGYVRYASVANDSPLHVSSFREGTGSRCLVLPREKSSYMENKNPWQKLLITLMGPAFSVLLCPICFTLVFMGSGIERPSIESVEASSPAEIAGIRSGDIVMGINGERATSRPLLQYLIRETREGDSTTLEIDRDGGKLLLVIAPIDINNNGYIGASLTSIRVPADFSESVNEAFVHSANIGKVICQAVGEIFKGKADSNSVTGPVGIIKMFTNSAKAGIGPYLALMGALSLNLAIFNMLPFPPLDGGNTLIYGFEAVSSKKLPESAVGLITWFFTIVLVALFVMTFIWDLRK